MYIPWLTFVIFMVISIMNSKNMINLVLLVFTFILLFWHISADLITKNSNVRLARGWGAFTLVSALIFSALILFQIISIDVISQTSIIVESVNLIPSSIRENKRIIGFENFTEFTTFELAAKFFAYVVYLGLTVITRRHIEKDAKKIEGYEMKDGNLINKS